MKLFDDFERTDVDPAGYSEANYPYLNRTARPKLVQARQILEEWFEQYPDLHKAELHSRFCLDDDTQHRSALFELMMHQLLLNLNCDIQIHPIVPTGEKSPDFLVKTQEGDTFYLEATIATYKSKSQQSAEAIKNKIYDILNRKLHSPNFFLWIDTYGTLNTQPSTTKIKNFLEKKLKQIDPDEVTKTYNEMGFDSIPQWVYRHEDFSIVFRPIPKKASARDKSKSRPVGVVGSDVRIKTQKSLKSSISEKVSRYGDLQQPYIVAVLLEEPGGVSHNEIMNALFGDEQSVTDLLNDNSNIELDRFYVPDSVWVTSNGKTKNSRLSGVLIVQELYPWHIPSCQICLYHNPWAKRPYNSILCQMPQAVFNKGAFQYISGLPISDILN